MCITTLLNANNNVTPFISGGGGGGGGVRFSSLMAATAAPSTQTVLFTALAGLALVAVVFYGARR